MLKGNQYKMSPIDTMWIIKCDNTENEEFKTICAVCTWFKNNENEVLLKNNHGYYPRMKDTNKRGISAVKEICNGICNESGVKINVASVLNIIPLLKQHYTLIHTNDKLEGIVVYDDKIASRVVKNKDEIFLVPYNPVEEKQKKIKSNNLNIFKELLDEEELDNEELKELITYLVDKL